MQVRTHAVNGHANRNPVCLFIRDSRHSVVGQPGTAANYESHEIALFQCVRHGISLLRVKVRSQDAAVIIG
jgi:hypothetical protein